MVTVICFRILPRGSRGILLDEDVAMLFEPSDDELSLSESLPSLELSSSSDVAITSVADPD